MEIEFVNLGSHPLRARARVTGSGCHFDTPTPVRTREGYKTANIADLQTPALRLGVGNRVGNGFELIK